jgi:hypothetical protein
MGEGSFFCGPRSQNPSLAILIDSYNSISTPPWENPVFHAADMATLA